MMVRLAAAGALLQPATRCPTSAGRRSPGGYPMCTATLRICPIPRGPVGCALALAAACFLLAAVPAPAQEQDGLFVSVPNPIRDEAVQQIRLKVKDALERQKRPVGSVVFDFSPDSQSSNFGSCSDLADYIRSLQTGGAHGVRIKTVAFVHGAV